MALINELTNIGNAIREKTGGTELIPLKEMASAIQGISSGGGAELDHTVTFMVDGQPYEIVSVKDGNSVSKPLTDPTSESGKFTGWQVDENKVTFPYLPTDDTDLTALFQNVRSGMETDKAGTNLSTLAGTKVNDGLAIYGYTVFPNGLCVCALVSKTSNGSKMSKGTTGASFTYDGETYYLHESYATVSETQCNDGELTEYAKVGKSGESLGEQALGIAILDHYFMKEV